MRPIELACAVVLAACAAPKPPRQPARDLEADREAFQCWDGDARACYRRGRRHMVDGDNACWAKLLHHACRLGDRQGCAERAAYFPAETGSIGRDCLDHPNPRRELALDYARRCAAGDAAACYGRGAILLEYGDGECAATLFARACELGVPEACDAGRADPPTDRDCLAPVP